MSAPASAAPWPRMLSPERIAVIGASEAPGNRGGQAVGLLRRFGYQGQVLPVHPSGKSVKGYRCVRSVDELPEPADVALVGVGARNVASVVADVGRAGIPWAIVWAGGFAEQGPQGAQLQQELGAAARSAGVRLLGPNCLGLVNSTTAYCGTFASWLRSAPELLPGHISMVTQSGGLGAVAHAAAQNAGVGFRFMVSTGNEVDIRAVELLEVFAEDPGTRVICCYLEGMTEGRRLVDAVHRARAAGKDFVVLKGGRSAASARAAAAHTGALAGQARVWDSILAGAGAIQVYSVEELVDVTLLLASAAERGARGTRGTRVAVMSYGGGSGVLAADQCSMHRLDVPAFAAETQQKLRPLLPAIASAANPIDMTPEAFNQPAYRERFPEVLGVIAGSEEIDALLFQGGSLQGDTDVAASDLCQFHRASGKVLAVYWRDLPQPAAAVFRDHGINVFARQEQAVSALSRVMRKPLPGLGGGVAQARRFDDTMLPAVSSGSVVSEPAVHALLRGSGIRTLPGRLTSSARKAVRAAEEIGFPVAMKVASQAITHRDAAGLVRLRIGTVDEADAAFRELVARAQGEGADVQGVYVQAMASAGTEFLVSVFRDQTFGAVVSCGAGGVYAEVLDDVVFAPAPFTLAQAQALAGRLRIAKYLSRTGRIAHVDSLAVFLRDVAELGSALPWADFTLEVNPVIATATEAVAVDGLLVVDNAARCPEPGPR
jgi:acetate---CoA ligase (ADP-forming)